MDRSITRNSNNFMKEDIQGIEADLKDAIEVWENAKKETIDASQWEQKMRLNVEHLQAVLEDRKNKE